MSALLDTNVVSELICKAPDPAVEAWTAGHPLEELFFSAVGEAELRYGTAILPVGRRRETLVSDIARMLCDAFENRVLPFDSEAVRAYANIDAMRHSAGRPVAPADCQIAAIAHSRNMTVATRNVRDFEDFEVEVVDPMAAKDQVRHHANQFGMPVRFPAEREVAERVDVSTSTLYWHLPTARAIAGTKNPAY